MKESKTVSPGTTRKSAYSTPRLVKYGDFQKLTRGFNQNGNDPGIGRPDSKN